MNVFSRPRRNRKCCIDKDGVAVASICSPLRSEEVIGQAQLKNLINDKNASCQTGSMKCFFRANSEHTDSSLSPSL